ncbi:protocadherin-15-like [Opisthocomus hoazin]|uniref:protocadherin-15-like n=1 Tax=Opisthocomus hoazin TaxID=30419 RepID=UPI003F5324E9
MCTRVLTDTHKAMHTQSRHTHVCTHTRSHTHAHHACTHVHTRVCPRCLRTYMCTRVCADPHAAVTPMHPPGCSHPHPCTPTPVRWVLPPSLCTPTHVSQSLHTHPCELGAPTQPLHTHPWCSHPHPCTPTRVSWVLPPSLCTPTPVSQSLHTHPCELGAPTPTLARPPVVLPSPPLHTHPCELGAPTQPLHTHPCEPVLAHPPLQRGPAPRPRPPSRPVPGQQRRGRRRRARCHRGVPVPVPMAESSCPALLAACLALQLAAARGDGCSGFGNIFTEITENSAHGTLVARLPAAGDAGSAGLQLCLAGADAVWFYLDGRSLRLNVSAGRALDREELESPVLMVALTCAEDGFSPVEYRIIVQVLNENDNQPHFQGANVLTHNISELAAVHSVVFSAQAEDADGDTLMYVIDTASPDARFFRIDLPNSGKVVLARALDFESRQQLEVVVTAVEMTTKERFSASARVRVTVLDGDDQYPQFLPCTPRAHRGLTLCTSPVYTANVTEGQLPGGPLSFSPGSVHAEDGDRGLRTPITYSLLAGEESGRFHIDNATGAITLLRAVESSRRTPAIRLSVVAAQLDDAGKYAVTQAVVRVLAPNRHPPAFPRAAYRAFVPAGAPRAALLLTFGGHVLALRALDADFPEGMRAGVPAGVQAGCGQGAGRRMRAG